MSTAELMAKMTPHGVVITGEGFGGFAKMDAMDIAGALGMGNLDRAAYLFGLLKYCGDHQVLGDLDRIIRGHVYHIGKFEGWKLADAELCGLATLALYENLEECRYTDYRRAVMAGVCAWSDEWSARADRCHAVVRQMDLDAIAHIKAMAVDTEARQE